MLCQFPVRWQGRLPIPTCDPGLEGVSDVMLFGMSDVMLFDMANDPHETRELVQERAERRRRA